ncbi:hypothetical protein [Paragemmobacter straminiformis]|uniref:Uncharacterized protein n=1 Tax=Paragemmobacter straminiformis TaxID=2045119 RepID=A0A842I7I1_9RHOB|nr:hypothetical protein [Gemmobacter straminiformis]MBC2835353.1 hypothetical protein [Gemmobacter straminiformis]
MTVVLMLGSAPMALQAAAWKRAAFDSLLAINNAHAVRPDWDYHIYPWDYPEERRPVAQAGQRTILQEDFVPAQNAYGGFVYAGGTMAFTAAYWALHALRPQVIAAFGCDMHYGSGQTHFYGKGSADPLRDDITLQSLEAKSARLMVLAAMQGCAMVNLSAGPSRQVFPRVTLAHLRAARPPAYDAEIAGRALRREAELGYFVASGRYWEEAARFDPAALRELDALWLAAAQEPLAAIA